MEVYMLLDRTGSMADKWDETITSINVYVSELAKDSDEHLITLATFDHYEGRSTFDILKDKVAIKEWDPLTGEESSPRGMTPLLDAVVKMIAKAEESNPEKAVIVIMTDGEENFSKEVTKETARAAVERAKGKEWQVLFLGADFDAFSEAGAIGLSVQDTVTVNKGSRSSGMSHLASASCCYAATGQSIGFNDEDRKHYGS